MPVWLEEPEMPGGLRLGELTSLSGEIVLCTTQDLNGRYEGLWRPGSASPFHKPGVKDWRWGETQLGLSESELDWFL